MKEFVSGRLKHRAGVIIHQRDTIFVRRKPHERVSLGRENYTQEHALSMLTLFRCAIVLVLPKILISSTCNSKFFLHFCSLRYNVKGGFSSFHGWGVIWFIKKSKNKKNVRLRKVSLWFIKSSSRIEVSGQIHLTKDTSTFRSHICSLSHHLLTFVRSSDIRLSRCALTDHNPAFSLLSSRRDRNPRSLNFPSSDCWFLSNQSSMYPELEVVGEGRSPLLLSTSSRSVLQLSVGFCWGVAYTVKVTSLPLKTSFSSAGFESSAGLFFWLQTTQRGSSSVAVTFSRIRRSVSRSIVVWLPGDTRSDVLFQSTAQIGAESCGRCPLDKWWDTSFWLAWRFRSPCGYLPKHSEVNNLLMRIGLPQSLRTPGFRVTHHLHVSKKCLLMRFHGSDDRASAAIAPVIGGCRRYHAEISLGVNNHCVPSPWWRFLSGVPSWIPAFENSRALSGGCRQWVLSLHAFATVVRAPLVTPALIVTPSNYHHFQRFWG